MGKIGRLLYFFLFFQCLTGCAEVPDRTNLDGSQWVGNISFDAELDNPSFELCRPFNIKDLFSGIIKRLQAANFILHFVKKPRRCIGIACVFCLIQYKILLTFAHS